MLEMEKILCLTETKGQLSVINSLAREKGAALVIHAGDFGFHDEDSYKRLSDKELRACVQYSSLSLGEKNRLLACDEARLRDLVGKQVILSEFPDYASGRKSFEVPVYVIYGNQEDIVVLEKVKSGTYKIPNLFLVDESCSFKLPIGNIRLFGLGGSIAYPKLFDYGSGVDSIAGAEGSIWSTWLQFGELLETAKVQDSSEVRIFLCHTSPGKEPLLRLLSRSLKADYVVSGGLHSRYCVLYNDFAVCDVDSYNQMINNLKDEFLTIWEHAEPVISTNLGPAYKTKLEALIKCFDLSFPPVENYLKNCWHLNLPDVRQGHATLEIENEKICIHTESLGTVFTNKRKSIASRNGSIDSFHPSKPFAIFLGNAPMNLKDSDFSEFFRAHISNFQEFYIKKENYQNGTPYSNYRVEFSSHSDLQNALNMTGKDLHGQSVRIQIYRSMPGSNPKYQTARRAKTPF